MKYLVECRGSQQNGISFVKLRICWKNIILISQEIVGQYDFAATIESVLLPITK